MLEKLPDAIGHALQGVRPGLEKTVYHHAASALDAPETIIVESAAFADGAAIPARYTADGAQLSFPLSWRGVPAEAGAVMAIIEDADSPTPVPLVHTLLFDEPPHDAALPEGALKSPGGEGAGHALGRNSFLKCEYLPPDPPPGHGPHRYVVQVFALKHAAGLDQQPSKHDVLKALEGNVLAKGRLIGTYERA